MKKIELKLWDFILKLVVCLYSQNWLDFDTQGMSCKEAHTTVYGYLWYFRKTKELAVLFLCQCDSAIKESLDLHVKPDYPPWHIVPFWWFNRISGAPPETLPNFMYDVHDEVATENWFKKWGLLHFF